MITQAKLCNGRHVTLLPTRTCFDDASYLMMILKWRQGKQPVLAHGICGARVSRGYAHAWVLCEGDVFQMAMVDGKKEIYTVPISEFYKVWKARRETQYSFDEYLALHKGHDHSGPWKEEYRKLCRDYKA